jgi:hypothetical protein
MPDGRHDLLWIATPRKAWMRNALPTTVCVNGSTTCATLSAADERDFE